MKGQKSIIRTLTNRSFKANKTRNLIAVFAIVLTTVMFTSLFVLSQSMVENMRNMNFQQAGYNSHLSSSTMTDADMEKIVAHEAVRDYGKSTIIGVAENKELTGRQVEIRYADENYARSSFSYPTTGTMPVQENEIALKQNYRLLGSYEDANGVKFWIITEADRRCTTILLPEEY